MRCGTNIHDSASAQVLHMLYKVNLNGILVVHPLLGEPFLLLVFGLAGGHVLSMTP